MIYDKDTAPDHSPKQLKKQEGSQMNMKSSFRTTTNPTIEATLHGTILKYKWWYLSRFIHQSELKAKSKLSFTSSGPGKLFYLDSRTQLVPKSLDLTWLIMLAVIKRWAGKYHILVSLLMWFDGYTQCARHWWDTLYSHIIFRTYLPNHVFSYNYICSLNILASFVKKFLLS